MRLTYEGGSLLHFLAADNFDVDAKDDEYQYSINASSYGSA